MCNLVAPSAGDAQGTVQAGSRAETYGAGNRTVGDRLLQTVPAPMPVIEKAIETAALMLGSDKSRGYCLEMICADFLAGANLDHGDPGTLLFSMMRFFRLLPENQKQAFLESLHEKAS